MDAVKLPCLLNLAACQIKIKDFSDCVITASKVCSFDWIYTKGSYIVICMIIRLWTSTQRTSKRYIDEDRLIPAMETLRRLVRILRRQSSWILRVRTSDKSMSKSTRTFKRTNRSRRRCMLEYSIRCLPLRRLTQRLLQRRRRNRHWSYYNLLSSFSCNKDLLLRLQQLDGWMFVWPISRLDQSFTTILGMTSLNLLLQIAKRNEQQGGNEFIYNCTNTYIYQLTMQVNYTREGWLDKQGAVNNSNWNKRYFILSEALLKRYQRNPKVNH